MLRHPEAMCMTMNHRQENTGVMPQTSLEKTDILNLELPERHIAA